MVCWGGRSEEEKVLDGKKSNGEDETEELLRRGQEVLGRRNKNEEE